MFDSLWPHGLQHSRLLCPPLSPGVCLNSCPLSQWCYLIILSLCHLLCIRWPKYWSFSLSPSNEYSGLISFRIEWFDPTVQGTLRSLLQHPNGKSSIFWRSAFLMVQLSRVLTTRKTIALTRWTFVDKVMSLLFNMLSRFVITFLRSNHFLSLYPS